MILHVFYSESATMLSLLEAAASAIMENAYKAISPLIREFYRDGSILKLWFIFHSIKLEAARSVMHIYIYIYTHTHTFSLLAEGGRGWQEGSASQGDCRRDVS